MTATETAPALSRAAPQVADRIPALDGVRAIASLMVVAYHFGPHLIRDASSRFALLLRFPRHGVEGVDLFFVLSGFLISRMLVDARFSPRYFRTFYIRRFFRIFPLYYLTLAAYTIAAAITARPGRLFENPLPLWAYWTYLQNFAMAVSGSWGAIWMAGTWSLAIEEQFYLTLPALIKRVSDRMLLRAAAAGFIGAIGVRALLQYTKLLPGIAGRVLLPARLDSLAAGIFIMLLLRNYAGAMRRRLGFIRCAGILASAIWLLFPALPANISVRMAFLDSGISSFAFALFLLNLLLAPEASFAKALSARSLRLLGNMAYSTYLLHPILLCVAFQAMRGVDPRLNGPSDIPPLVAALAATLLLSFASWIWLEQPLIARGRRFKY